MYRVYFIYPMKSEKFDGEGLKKYVKWVSDRLGSDCLGSGCGLSDLEETQPVFGNMCKGIAYFDFTGRIEAFDAFDRKDFVEILDKMLEFTDTPPEIQGVFFDNTETEEKKMNVLERYVDRINAGDPEGIVDCWVDEGAIFDDEAAKLLRGEPAYYEGKDAIRAVFKRMCDAKATAEIIEMAEDGKSMAYNIYIAGHVLECRGTVEVEEDGKYKVYACRPRN